MVNVLGEINGRVYYQGLQVSKSESVGYDGKAPVGLFHQLVIDTGKWRHVKLALELDDHSVGTAASGSIGTIPTPRYGHAMGIDNQGVITVFGGSGSMYLNDVFQILTVEDEED